MALKADVKTTYEASRVIQPIFTGGSVGLSGDGKILATCLGEEALLSSLETGQHLARIEGDGEAITSLALSSDASFLVVCSRSLSMRTYVLQPSDDAIEATLARTVKPHTTPVVTTATDWTSSLLATGGADGVVKVWDLRGGYTTHTFHGHSGVISALHFFEVATHSEEQASKSRKRKSQEIDEVQNEATAGFRLASGGEDGRIRVWDLHKRKGVATLESHASIVRSLDFSTTSQCLLSASRDKTAILWDARSWQIRSTVPVLEVLEKAGFIKDGSLFYTGGETARLRLWRAGNGQEMTEESLPGSETEAIVDILHHPGLELLLSVHADQTFLVHSLSPLQNPSREMIPPLPVLQRISGTHDEVIDLAYIGIQRDVMALATNLEDLRLISIDKDRQRLDGTSHRSGYFGADVGLLKGHSDIIITIDTDWSGHWLATGAKDNTARLWRLDPDNDSYTCYATFTGHAESISAVALPNSIPTEGSKEFEDPLSYPPKYLITGSQDKTVKRWDIAGQADKSSRAVYTRKAHDKDINAIEISYSSTAMLFASASQDRTVKIWDAGSGEAIGVLRGHKRGVWSVAFSPPSSPALTMTESGGSSSAKGMVVTGSGDKTVRIWNLSDYSCLRTFEGHANSVLKVVWIPNPGDGKGRNEDTVQVASAAGDGLVKVWNAQAGECAATLDNHIDRVWALAVKPQPARPVDRQTNSAMARHDDGNDNDTPPLSIEMVSGSADSTLTFWTDTTATTAQEASTQATARIEQDQELQNYMRSANYREAIVLALQLNHPRRLLELFTAVVNGKHQADSFSGNIEIDEVLASLSDSQLWALLRRLRDWNANARTHNVAQHILYALLLLHSKDRLLGLRKRRRQAHAADKDGGVNDDLANTMAALDTRDERGERKESMKDILDALKAYTERHHARLEQTSDERFVLLWALQQMDDVGGEIDAGVHGGFSLQSGHVGGDQATPGDRRDVIMLESSM